MIDIKRNSIPFWGWDFFVSIHGFPCGDSAFCISLFCANVNIVINKNACILIDFNVELGIMFRDDFALWG